MHFTPHLLRAMRCLHPEHISLPLKRTRMVVLLSLLAFSSWATICRACLASVQGEFCERGTWDKPPSALLGWGSRGGTSTLAAGGGGALLRGVVGGGLATTSPGPGGPDWWGSGSLAVLR